jgi:hypothetical protein
VSSRVARSVCCRLRVCPGSYIADGFLHTAPLGTVLNHRDLFITLRLIRLLYVQRDAVRYVHALPVMIVLALLCNCAVAACRAGAANLLSQNARKTNPLPIVRRSQKRKPLWDQDCLPLVQRGLTSILRLCECFYTFRCLSSRGNKKVQPRKVITVSARTWLLTLRGWTMHTYDVRFKIAMLYCGKMEPMSSSGTCNHYNRNNFGVNSQFQKTATRLPAPPTAPRSQSPWRSAALVPPRPTTRVHQASACRARF